MNDAAKNHMDAWAVEDVGARVAARIVCPTTGAPITSLGGGAAGGNASIHEFDHLVSVRVKHAHLIAAAPAMLDALKKAEQFITNGVELGFIRMPEMKADPANETPEIIRAAIAKATGAAQ